MNRSLALAFASLTLAALAACASSEGANVAAAQQDLDDGREAARENDHARAVSLFSRAARGNPDLAEAYYERGKSYIKMRLDPKTEGDVRTYEQKALDDFSKAIAKNPAFADAYFNRAMVLSSRAQYKPAVEDLFNAARYKPRDPDPHLYMAQIYEMKFEDKMPIAMEHYEKYVDLGGTDPDARDKAKLWKSLTQPKPGPTPTAPQTKPPTAEDEKKAMELHSRALDLLRQPDKSEAVKIFEQLLTEYGQTKYVQEKAPAIKAAIVTFKKKDAPK